MAGEVAGEEGPEAEAEGEGSGVRSAGSTSCTTAQHVSAMAWGAAACGMGVRGRDVGGEAYAAG